MIGQFITGRVAVFIDAANLESSLKSLGWHMDYRKLRSVFPVENLVALRYYCVRHNTGNQDQFFAFLKHAGYCLFTKPIKVIRDVDVEKGKIRKANFDVEIALDVLRMLDAFDTLALFSGDSDFDYLIRQLHDVGKRVIVVSTRYHVSRELVQRCDKYIDLRKLRSGLERKDGNDQIKSPSFATGS